ncbi:MAG: TfuA-like protein [Granulosicoccus sp.]
MNIIFAGPTLSHADVRQYLNCVCLPPVAHGDILNVLRQSPQAIGIIDGYFEGAPSVWHKEILYAMDQGVSVYGSASMGALRAAELCAFGMIGVGKVFEGYRDLQWEDDDEVAVLHGPEEAGYIVASVPMVNIRATLDVAHKQDVISRSQKEALQEHGKNTFYKKRSWNSLLDACSELFPEASLRDRLDVWLSDNKVDQKRDDAIQMLQLMNEEPARVSAESEKMFYFQWTSVWDTAYREHQHSQFDNRLPDDNDQKVLAQLRLDPDVYIRYRERALLSRVCKYPMDQHVDEQTLKLSLKTLRANNKLDSRSQLMEYMSKADLNESTLSALLTDASRVDLVRQAVGDLQSGIIDQLKVDGAYVGLLEVASCKERALDVAVDACTDDRAWFSQVISWYFQQRQGVDIPVDLHTYLSRIDIADSEDFYRLITQEYLYWLQSE